MRVPAELMKESQQYISIIGGCLFLQAMQLTLSSFFLQPRHDEGIDDRISCY